MAQKYDLSDKQWFKQRQTMYRREVFVVIKSLIILVCLLALGSYHPSDPSWAMISSSQPAVANWCGMWGAMLAAIVFYLFGASGYLCALFLAMQPFLFWIAQRKRWFFKVVFFGGGFLCSSALLFSLYKWSLFYGHGGGLIGDWLAEWFVYGAGSVGSQLIAWTWWWASLSIYVQLPLGALAVGFLSACKSVCVVVWERMRRTMSKCFKSVAFWKKTSVGQDLPPLSRVLGACVCADDDEVLESAEDANISCQETMEELQQSDNANRHGFVLPDKTLFCEGSAQVENKISNDELESNARILEEKLVHFGIKGKVEAIRPGPVVTMYEYKPDIDSKISKIVALEDDIAMALTAQSLRVIAPLPGRDVIGFEIANQQRDAVLFSHVFDTLIARGKSMHLPLVLGVDGTGQSVVADLASMPHLLVGGTTGSGKSVGLHCMLASLLTTRSPQELKMILIDPKRLEFSSYASIPHLLFPVVTRPAQVATVLQWAVREMEERYETMAKVGVRGIAEYAKMVKTEAIKDARPMPYIVVVIDELADLMMVAGKDVERLLVRLAQMARAAGIHVIVATQRPSVDVVTGLIKVNFPSRVAFRVSSRVDSRTILDMQGAEKLLGKGDMLMLSASSDCKRVHGAFIGDEEIARLVQFWADQGKAELLNLEEVAAIGSARNDESEQDDSLYQEICSFIKTTEEISISMLQRHYRIGFNRSARIIEKLERDGLLAPAQAGKPRRVLR